MIGIDTVSVARIAQAIKSDAFKTKVFTAREIEYCDSRPDPAQSYAGIFSAKEAAVKAAKCGFSGGVLPINIEIAHDALGVPALVFNGKALCIFDKYKFTDVSISHDAGIAIAVVQLI